MTLVVQPGQEVSSFNAFMSCGILTLAGCSRLYCNRFLTGSGRLGLSEHKKWGTLAALMLTHTGLAFNQAGSADTRIKLSEEKDSWSYLRPISKQTELSKCWGFLSICALAKREEEGTFLLFSQENIHIAFLKI